MSKKITTSVAKIGIIYTISNLLVRGMAFLTTPIFARLLTKAEYGEFNNISSWANIISIIVTLQLYVSILRAKYDYKEKIDEYLSSILVLGNVITLIWWGIVELNLPFFENVLDMNRLYIRLIFIYCLFSPAMQILTYKNRIYSQYKQVVCLTLVTLITATGSSIILVLLLEDKLLGRTVGNYFLISIVDIFLWLYIILKGKKISPRYWKYALSFSLPLLPHELAGQLLVSSDRIIIKRLCGPDVAGVYSLAYIISSIANVFLSSINQAWQPWLYDKIEEKNHKEIYKVSVPYALVFACGCFGVMLVGPEIVMIFGGEKYMDAISIIPPVCFGFMLQFVYTLYANIEFYKKMTSWISMATFIAATLNVALNFLCIPVFGYKVAAYTTAIGYAVMVLIHYLVVRFRTDLAHIYNRKIIVLITLVMLALSVVTLFLYKTTYIRYGFIAVYFGVLIVLMVKNRKQIKKLLANKKRK